MILPPGKKLKLKPQDQAIPRESYIGNGKFLALTVQVPSLPTADFTYQSWFSFLLSPRLSLISEQCSLQARSITLRWLGIPGGSELMCDLPTVHKTAMLTTPERGHGNIIFFTGYEGLVHCVLNSP